MADQISVLISDGEYIPGARPGRPSWLGAGRRDIFLFRRISFVEYYVAAIAGAVKE
jgi:hypothetical protein